MSGRCFPSGNTPHGRTPGIENSLRGCAPDVSSCAVPLSSEHRRQIDFWPRTVEAHVTHRPSGDHMGPESSPRTVRRASEPRARLPIQTSWLSVP